MITPLTTIGGDMRKLSWLIVVVGVIAPAFADTDQDKRDCARRLSPADKRIAACSRLIDDEALTEKEHAWALYHRAYAYSNQSKAAEALADLENDR